MSNVKRFTKAKDGDQVEPPEPPAVASGDLFEVTDVGVFYCKEGLKPQRVCGRLDVRARVRDRDYSGWCRLVEFRDHDNRLRRELIEDRLLDGDGAALAGELRHKGLDIGHSKSGLLRQYLNSRNPITRGWRTGRLGWHESPQTSGEWTFVLPRGLAPIAPDGGDEWIFTGDGAGHARFAQRGTAEQWRQQVAALASGNSRALFALSAGFATGLVWLSQDGPGVFHWTGNSSIGKSVLLDMTVSMAGPPAYKRTWHSTGANAMEVVCAGHTDCPFALDELKQGGNARDVAQAVYMLASGMGKSRATAGGGGLRELAEFRALAQSNGELSLSQFLEQNKERSYAGQEVRFVELPADAGAGHGVWDVIHGFDSGQALSEAAKRRGGEVYGHAFLEFVGRVLEHRSRLQEEFEQTAAAFRAQHLTAKAEGQANRAATRFALVGYAGEKAAAWGVTGWQKGEAGQAAGRIFQEWLQARGGEGNAEKAKMVRQVREWLQRHRSIRLADMRRSNEDDPHVVRVQDQAGWRRYSTEGVVEFLMHPEVFEREVCQGFDHRAVLRELASAGYLKRDKEGRFKVNAKEPGVSKTSRFYLVSDGILSGEEHEST